MKLASNLKDELMIVHSEKNNSLVSLWTNRRRLRTHFTFITVLPILTIEGDPSWWFVRSYPNVTLLPPLLQMDKTNNYYGH